MALKKSSIYDRNAVGNNLQERTNSNIVNAIFGEDRKETNSRVIYEEVDINDITPRPINNYSQTRIAKLARSIRETNDRLIHPITLARPQDLPANNEVILKLKKEGKNIDDIKYIVVAGERRFRAWLMNREENQKRIDEQGLIESNSYDTITANILTKEEAQNEQRYYEDSNNEARQLTPVEAIRIIIVALDEVVTDAQKRRALIDMNGGSEEGIPVSDYEAAKKFNSVRFVRYYLEDELGIVGWSDSTIKQYISIVRNCTDEVLKAITDSKFPPREARKFTKLPHSTQNELIKIYLENPEEYKLRNDSLMDPEKNEKAKKVKRFSHKDVRKQLTDLIGKMEEAKGKLELIAPELGRDDKASTKKTINQIEDMISKLKDRENLFK